MQKDGRIDPSACTLTLYSANGHVTGGSLSTPVQIDGLNGTVAADAAKDGGPNLNLCGGQIH